MSWADLLFNQFAAGDMWGAVMGQTGVYGSILGQFFYGILFVLALTMIYMKTQNFGTTVIVGMLSSTFMIFMAPSLSPMSIVLCIALGVTAIVYRIFR